jgi:large-conductance mechanosensitive channel
MAKIKDIFEEFMEGSRIFGELISAIINLILLSTVYFIGVGLTSIIARISGKRFLDNKLSNKSYWKELNLTTRPFEEYYRQF